MKWIKRIWYFLTALIAMSIIGFFGLMGIASLRGIFDYLFTHCSDLLGFIIFFVIGLIGVVIGWFTFCDSLDKFKNS